METTAETSADDAYRFESSMTDLMSHHGLAVDVYLRAQRIAFIRCDFWKENRLLIVTDMDTDYRFRRRGLGRMRFAEALMLLERNGLRPEKIVAEDVGAYSTTAESRKAAEAFFKSLGFKQESDSYNWSTSFRVLRDSLYAGLRTEPYVRKVEAFSP